MNNSAVFVCDLCNRSFGVLDEVYEHLDYEHQLQARFITVEDPANQEPEPEGL